MPTDNHKLQGAQDYILYIDTDDYCPGGYFETCLYCDQSGVKDFNVFYKEINGGKQWLHDTCEEAFKIELNK